MVVMSETAGKATKGRGECAGARRGNGDARTRVVSESTWTLMVKVHMKGSKWKSSEGKAKRQEKKVEKFQSLQWKIHRRKRVSVQTDLLSHCFQGSTWTARGLAWSDHCLQPERVFREREALHCHRGTRAQEIHSEHDHWRVACRQPNYLDACTQNSSPSSCRVHTKRGISRDR